MMKTGRIVPSSVVMRNRSHVNVRCASVGGSSRGIEEQRSTTRDNVACSRRSLGASLLLSIPAISLFWSMPNVEPAMAGFSKSAKEYAAEAKARKEKLKSAAAAMKSKGKASEAFEESKYSVPEDSKTVKSRE